MRIRTYGHSALHVELDTLDQVLQLHLDLCRDPLPGMVETVPAARTLLVSFDRSGTDPVTIAREIRARGANVCLDGTHRPGHGPTTEVPVHYDGEDLDDVARLTRCSPRQVVDRHLARTYVVALIGFAPGFYFLSGGDDVLRVPRRATPRASVPAGAVGLAGEFTGIYPRTGPGGWQLIGRTSAPLWDRGRTPAALLSPGTRVRFVEASP